MSGISKFSLNTVFIFRSDFLTTIPFEFCWERENKHKIMHQVSNIYMQKLKFIY